MKKIPELGKKCTQCGNKKFPSWQNVGPIGWFCSKCKNLDKNISSYDLGVKQA